MGSYSLPSLRKKGYLFYTDHYRWNYRYYYLSWSTIPGKSEFRSCQGKFAQKTLAVKIFSGYVSSWIYSLYLTIDNISNHCCSYENSSELDLETESSIHCISYGFMCLFQGEYVRLVYIMDRLLNNYFSMVNYFQKVNFAARWHLYWQWMLQFCLQHFWLRFQIMDGLFVRHMLHF